MRPIHVFANLIKGLCKFSDTAANDFTFLFHIYFPNFAYIVNSVDKVGG